jgi:serine/threonine-protein kinase
MTSDRWHAIETVFDEAADLPPSERRAFLERACRTPEGDPDPALREEVERLLALDVGAEAFFESPALPDPDRAPPEAGPWRLTERVGVGGMGEVWRAERADGAFHQAAAVKLVRPGLGDDLLRRFRSERAVLARLDHPAIARLLDAGTASDGRPYLALEFVEGEPITDFCDRRRLGVNERLALFGDVCEAVAAAHRRLVVHRDIKPSNVLVAETPEGPRVKLLDFGIAKLLDDDPALSLVQTRADRRVLTPEYAAPEQVRGEAPTTATDVYGLGVLLYELLTGQRPYRPASRVRRAIEQAILEADPTEPSTAVTDAQTARAAAEKRATQPDRLRRRLRGDLDQIILKALRKEPERRYDGAAALAADLGRHLGGLPIEARPESAGYRVGKFVRRHRAAVAAVGVALLGVLGGAGAALWQAREAGAERDRADARAAEAEAVTGFLVDLIGEARPSGSDGDTLRVRDVLDAGVAQLDTGFADRPLVAAALATAFARSYAELGQSDRAVPLFRRALGLRRAHLDPLDPEVVAAENALSLALLNTGDLDGVDSLMTAAVAARRTGLGAAHPQVAIALNDLGLAADDRRPDSLARAKAEGYFQEALDVIETAGPEAFAAAYDGSASYDGFRSGLYYSLAVHYMTTGRQERAVEPMGRAVDLADEPPESTSHQILANGYGVLLRQLERYDESIAVHREVVEAARRAHGPDHAFYGYPVLSLGSALQASGDAEGAIPVLREALRVFGGPEADTQAALDTRFYLGRALVEAGQATEGRRVLRAALPGLAETFGADNVRTRVARELTSGA